MRHLRRLLRDRRGVTALEYGVLAAAIATVFGFMCLQYAFAVQSYYIDIYNDIINIANNMGLG